MSFISIPEQSPYRRGPAGWEYQYVTTTDTSSIISTMIGVEQQNGDSMNEDYEIVLNDGQREYVERIRAVNHSNGFTAFQRVIENGSLKSVVIFRSDAILSYRPLPASEEVVRPKYTFKVTFQNGAAKTVQADLFKVSTFGEEKVYEFFSKTNSGTAREELSVPFGNVVMVERVDGDQDAPVTIAADLPKPVMDEMAEETPLPDYEAVVRPKRKV